MSRLFAKLWRQPTSEPGVTRHFAPQTECPPDLEAEAEAAGALEPLAEEGGAETVARPQRVRTRRRTVR
jgi:hypothetical protein